MSKKIMKRSLALGALMAFVITGSAMAAETNVVKEYSKDGYIKFLYKVSESGEVDGDALYSLDNSGVPYSETNEEYYTGYSLDYVGTSGSLKFNGDVEVKNKTTSTKNTSGSAAVIGVRAFYLNNTLEFAGENTNIEVISNGQTVNGVNSAIDAYGLSVWGTFDENGANIYGDKYNMDYNPNDKANTVKFSGNNAKIVVTGYNSTEKTHPATESDSIPKYGAYCGVNVNKDSKFVTTGNNVLEIEVNSKGKAQADGIGVAAGIVDAAGKITVTAKSEEGEAYGLNVDANGFTDTSGTFSDDAQVKLAGDTILNVKGGEKVVGVCGQNDVVIELADTTITATSENGRADGIWLSESTATVTGELNIEVEGGGIKDNVGAQGIRLAYSKATFDDDVNITAKATADSADARGLNILADPGYTASNAEFNGNVKIDVTSEGSATGAFVSGCQDAGVQFNGTNVEINVNAKNEAKGILAQYSAAVNASDETDVAITATSESGEAYGVYNKYNYEYAGTVALNGNVSIQADTAIFNSENTGSTTVGAEGKKVTIDGNVKANGGTITTTLGTADSYLNGAVNTANGATTTLNMVEGATWNVTEDSTITNVAGSGTVSVGETTTVTASNVSKTTTVAANEDYADALAADGVISEDEMKALQAKLNGAQNAMVGETDLTGVTTLTQEGGYVSNANVSNVGIRDMAGLALVAWRAENNDMNKRMGELRNANGEHGVWVRMVRGESEYSTVKNQYNTYQLGYDEKLSTDKSWTVGMALSYTDGESSFAKGSGENTSKAVAIYGSKLNADGSFVDLIAKYARIENEFDITGGVGGAEYDANGYTVSAEYGKRFEQGKDFWIEPQVELTYGKVGSAEYLTEKEYKVAQDSMESLVGRIGFSLGKDVKGGNVYARASYLYDFDGETELTFDDKVKMDQDFGGGWWEVGVGANINLSKATYIYADVEKTFGGEVDTNWQWNLGVRYSF